MEILHHSSFLSPDLKATSSQSQYSVWCRGSDLRPYHCAVCLLECNPSSQLRPLRKENGSESVSSCETTIPIWASLIDSIHIGLKKVTLDFSDSKTLRVCRPLSSLTLTMQESLTTCWECSRSFIGPNSTGYYLNSFIPAQRPWKSSCSTIGGAYGRLTSVV